jgi:hypothetical protein
MLVLVLRRVEHRKCERSGHGDDDADNDTERDRKAFDEHGQIIGTSRLELDGSRPAVDEVPRTACVARSDEAGPAAHRDRRVLSVGRACTRCASIRWHRGGRPTCPCCRRRPGSCTAPTPVRREQSSRNRAGCPAGRRSPPGTSPQRGPIAAPRPCCGDFAAVVARPRGAVEEQDRYNRPRSARRPRAEPEAARRPRLQLNRGFVKAR